MSSWSRAPTNDNIFESGSGAGILGRIIKIVEEGRIATVGTHE